MFLQNPNLDLSNHFLAFANPPASASWSGWQGCEESVNDLAEHLRMSQPRSRGTCARCGSAA